MTNLKLKQLVDALAQINFQHNVPLAQFTTVKIGGPAELLATCLTSEELTQLASLAFRSGIKPAVLGWGANTLIADSGVPGLVILNRTQQLKILDRVDRPLAKTDAPRWKTHLKAWHQHTQNINYYQRVLLDSGLALPVAINQLLAQGITGLEWFARIPGTIGGAVVNNIHGGNHFLGDFVEKVIFINQKGEKEELVQSKLDFAYDYSIFHQRPSVITQVILCLPQTNLSKAKKNMGRWAKTKAHQPQKSLGCIFKNLSTEEQELLNITTDSAGYVIDKLLKLGNLRIGDARVSSAHAAFIENVGAATAHDYLAVITTIVETARKQLQLELKPEIFFLGFTLEELSAIIPG